MRGAGVMLGVVAAVLGLAAPAFAQAPTDTFQRDVRCLAIALQDAGDRNPDVANAAIRTVFYFAGRIEGRSLKADAMGLAWAEQRKITLEERPAASRACAQVLMDKGREWQDRTAQLEAGR